MLALGKTDILAHAAITVLVAFLTCVAANLIF